ncbi:hypothetical protein VL20_6287 [Microcystis panniformis FACHB-1757]|uniref:Uncharacterized protein n=1 Tax=Microcystis panniformis FACHB-1757 TaxID=1638788 RepID=A0A0K1SA87_9CHRO|nr:hypothetical protein VL20_6287 [Microcystis panniformis FACHB-1757]
MANHSILLKILSLISSHAKLITCPIELKPLRGNDRHV